jgi:Sigma-70, region 4
MSRLDDLPPDQRATLSLLLRRGKSYAEVAGMLEIDERAVHARAHAALAVLAAKEARELTAAQREEVGDYLLGQRSGVTERLATRSYLDGSPQARAWATALAGELEPLAGSALPEIPNGARPAATRAAAAPAAASASLPTAPRPERAAQPRSAASTARIRGALLLVVIVAVVVVAIVLVTGGGGSSSNSAGSTGSAASETRSSGKETTGTQKSQAKEDKRITLTSPDASSKAVGVAEVLSEGSQYAFYLAAQHLAPSKGNGFFYAVWLYNSPSSYEALSRAPDVGTGGNVQGGALLPKDAGKYHTMLLTRETASKPTRPGPVILRGAFALR